MPGYSLLNLFCDETEKLLVRVNDKEGGRVNKCWGGLILLRYIKAKDQYYLYSETMEKAQNFHQRVHGFSRLLKTQSFITWL